jgi:hypothetical protein
MRGPRLGQELIANLVVAFSFAGAPGCLSFVHHVDRPAREVVAPCDDVQKCCRDKVYIFIIHGLDPCDVANLRGVRDYVNQLGFRKTYFGQLYHAGFFERELHRIHHECPEARFVLIGFSYGANAARDLAQSARAAHIPIDLLMYLGGNTLKNTPEDQPENAREIVNILATGCIWNGAEMDRAQNYNVSDVYHFGSPTHPLTLEILARELAVIGNFVPGSELPTPSPKMDGPAPTAPDTMPRAADRRDEWDFLKPVAKLPVRKG